MKKILGCLIVMLTSNCFLSEAQSLAGEYLDVNNIALLANADGAQGYNGTGLMHGFQYPKNSGKLIGVVNSLWIGGWDTGGNLHEAAMTYRQMGSDFFPGPLMDSSFYSATSDSFWNRVWKINKTTIDSFIVFTQTGLPAGYNIPQIIIDWPGNGNPAIGQSNRLAPFFDVNGDNLYNPNDGDYPVIQGDQAVLFLFNDDRNNHTETTAQKMGLEIQGMLYGFNCPDSALQHTIYLNYKIINRSATKYDSVYIGNWLDADINGGDYFATDVGRGACFFYGSNSFAGVYGNNKPSLGILYLNGPKADSTGLDETNPLTPHATGYGDGIQDNEKPGLGRTISYLNTPSSINGNPTLPIHYYNYLKGKWKNGSDLTYGGDGLSGSLACSYMFPENSDSTSLGVSPPQAAWFNNISVPFHYDRRGLGAYGPFTFRPGQSVDIDLAFVVGRNYTDTSTTASVLVLKQRMDCARMSYENLFAGCGCSSVSSGIKEVYSNQTELMLYPNPAASTLYIDYISDSRSCTMEIYDVRGQLIKRMESYSSLKQSINISDLSKGLYLLKVSDGKSVQSQRFIKQ